MIHRQKKTPASDLLHCWAKLLVIVLFATLPLRNVFAVEDYQHLFDIKLADGIPLSLPSDVAIGKSGNIYIVDGGNHRIVVFSHDGEFIRAIGQHGSAQAQFDGPVGLGLDAMENIYVADSGNHRVQVFTPAGDFLRQIAVTEKGKGVRPVDVVSTPNGARLYVTTSLNHKVMVYSGTGLLKAGWGGKGNNPGKFRYPATLAMSATENIYVIDVLNSRVQIFDQEGTLITYAGEWGVLPGQLFRPKGIAIDADENIYVSDSYMNVIEVFDSHKRFTGVIGKNNQPRLNTPTGLAVDKNKRLYVSEMLANKVSVFEPVE